MNGGLWDYIQLYTLSMSCWALYYVGGSVIKEVKKLMKKIKFLKDMTNKSPNSHNDYIIIQGKANKIYPRYGDYIDNSVVVSESNNTYYEDFYLNDDASKYIVQPYQGTRIHNCQYKYLAKSRRFLFDFFFLKSKSQTISNSDHIYIFGKLNKNPKDIIEEFHHLANIKPKEISGLSLTDLVYHIKSKHTTRIFFSSILGVLLSYITINGLRYYIWPKYKSLFRTIKTRTRIFCKQCDINPCNIMCEKCTNLSEYCDECYSGLQERINNDEIELANITCIHCSSPLVLCQVLINQNNLIV
jgi:hypothetical protein